MTDTNISRAGSSLERIQSIFYGFTCFYMPDKPGACWCDMDSVRFGDKACRRLMYRNMIGTKQQFSGDVSVNWFHVALHSYTSCSELKWPCWATADHTPASARPVSGGCKPTGQGSGSRMPSSSPAASATRTAGLDWCFLCRTVSLIWICKSEQGNMSKLQKQEYPSNFHLSLIFKSAIT